MLFMSVYQERPVGRCVDPLANNVLGGWVITALWMLRDSYAGTPYQKPLVFERFALLWKFTFDSSYACALQTSPQNAEFWRIHSRSSFAI